jgi:hypothetical protein
MFVSILRCFVSKIALPPINVAGNSSELLVVGCPQNCVGLQYKLQSWFPQRQCLRPFPRYGRTSQGRGTTNAQSERG